ncbi:MAG: hypothetical protein K2X00_15790 [Nitrospiraceae bacterium]|nr:hypothetical protein [Nitrospiraceae bacterium]
MYDFVLKKYFGEIEWCAFIDADEFLYPSSGYDIRSVIPRFGTLGVPIGAIAVHWHIYGSSGHIEKPSGLVIENYTRRAEDNFLLNRHVKSIVKLEHAIRPLTSHLFEVRYGIFDDAGNDLHMNAPYGFFEEKPATHKLLRCNHYHVRSKAEYRKKAMRGYFGIDDAKLEGEQKFQSMFECHDRNEVEDDSALRFRQLMNFFLEPGRERLALVSVES